MKFYGNDEGNDESYDLYASDDTSESDFDEFQLSDEDVEELNPMNESYITDGGFISISLKEPEPVSIFRTFFTEEILNLITDQTNMEKEKNKVVTREKPVNGKM